MPRTRLPRTPGAQDGAAVHTPGPRALTPTELADILAAANAQTGDGGVQGQDTGARAATPPLSGGAAGGAGLGMVSHRAVPVGFDPRRPLSDSDCPDGYSQLYIDCSDPGHAEVLCELAQGRINAGRAPSFDKVMEMANGTLLDGEQSQPGGDAPQPWTQSRLTLFTMDGTNIVGVRRGDGVMVIEGVSYV